MQYSQSNIKRPYNDCPNRKKRKQNEVTMTCQKMFFFLSNLCLTKLAVYWCTYVLLPICRRATLGTYDKKARAKQTKPEISLIKYYYKVYRTESLWNVLFSVVPMHHHFFLLFNTKCISNKHATFQLFQCTHSIRVHIFF